MGHGFQLQSLWIILTAAVSEHVFGRAASRAFETNEPRFSMQCFVRVCFVQLCRVKQAHGALRVFHQLTIARTHWYVKIPTTTRKHTRTGLMIISAAATCSGLWLVRRTANV